MIARVTDSYLFQTAKKKKKLKKKHTHIIIK